MGEPLGVLARTHLGWGHCRSPVPAGVPGKHNTRHLEMFTMLVMQAPPTHIYKGVDNDEKEERV